MKNICPLTGRQIRAVSLKVYAEGEYRCEIPTTDAIEGLRMGLYEGVGSRRAVHALVLLKRPDDEFPGLLPIQKPTSYREHVGDSYVWQHAENAKTWKTA